MLIKVLGRQNYNHNDLLIKEFTTACAKIKGKVIEQHSGNIIV